jgi:uncharacterized damage-inducible protein DinB
MDDLRYPTGKFTFDPHATADKRRTWIRAIAEAPAAMRAAVAGLSDEQLDTPYRADGWTVRQVVHHVPDSHLNAYVRLKLALTEDSPTIKPYDEAAWALLADSETTPVAVSLALLEALHQRWVTILESMEAKDFDRTFVHPEHGPVTVSWLLQLYAWHGRHHAAHITALRKRNGWT